MKLKECEIHSNDFGKSYSARGLQERCSQGEQQTQKTPINKTLQQQKGVVNSRPAGQHKTTKGAFAAGMSALADNLLHPMHSHDLLHY